MLGEQLLHFAGEPARVAELEAVLGRRQAVEGGGEEVVVAVQALGQLPKHRSQPLRIAQGLQRLPESRDAFFDFSQAPHVSEVALAFTAKRKPSGVCSTQPSTVSRLGRR